MKGYIVKRLLLFPPTLLAILLINFAILNLAPGDPSSYAQITGEGAVMRADRGALDDPYLQFREFYGLTLPLFYNSWPWITGGELLERLTRIANKEDPLLHRELSIVELRAEKIAMGDRARFTMDQLLTIMEAPLPLDIRRQALFFFVRGGMRQPLLSPSLSSQERLYNHLIDADNSFLSQQLRQNYTPEQIAQAALLLKEWYLRPENSRDLKTWRTLFCETRLWRYMSRLIRLDFGTLRNDQNKTVWNEVTKRIKYSLTLSLLPILISFCCCQLLGAMMAIYHNRWPDHIMNIISLILYATPVFVVAPWLIEQFAIKGELPLGGFTSPPEQYQQMTSLAKLKDIVFHLILPLTALLYGSLAAQSRLSRTAFLEVMRQDYIRTAYAKGLAPSYILLWHIGRNSSITIVSSMAGSLGLLLGGSLIVETLFQIDGFGRFFYEAIINRDYNVILFSAIAGSFLSLIGYFAADLAYAALDPRVSFAKR